MRHFITLLLIMLSWAGFSQTAYETGMQKGLSLWGEGKITEASNTFERISAVEKDNWIPLYYVALVNILESFAEKDKDQLQLKLNKAKTSLEAAKKISPDNAELLVLEALHNTAWIAFDGATYGMTLGGPTTQIYKKALDLAPENPRAVLSYAEWNIGSARYFGTDISVYCKDVEKAVELFKTFKNETPFYPSWGEDRALELSKECK